MKINNSLNQLRFAGLIVGILLSGTVLAQKDTLSLIHITDLHVLFDWDSYQEDLGLDREKRDREAASFSGFLQTIPEKTKADMIIATGDLLDSYEAESRDGAMMNSTVEQFAGVAAKSKVPICMTLGNHDLVSYSWKKGSRLAHQNNAGQSRAAWIRNVPCFQNGTYYNQNYKVGNTIYQLIFLDNAYVKFSPEENISNPTIDKAQLHWLKARLQESSDDIEIILMHLPFSLKDNQPESSELYSLLSNHPSVRLILSGHQHKTRVVGLPSGGEMPTIQVQTADLMRSIENWRLISLTEKNILVSLPGKTKTELTIPVKQ